MVSSPDGGAMALAWPLDKLVGTDPSISLDPDVYVAMQTKLAERGQGSELDGSEDDDDSEDSGFTPLGSMKAPRAPDRSSAASPAALQLRTRAGRGASRVPPGGTGVS